MNPSMACTSGRLRIGLILFLALLGSGIYIGFQLAPYWINAYELQDFLVERARNGQWTTDADLRTAIIKKAKLLGITLTDEDIEIERASNQITVLARWQFDYNFFGLYSRTFVFAPQMTAKYQ